MHADEREGHVTSHSRCGSTAARHRPSLPASHLTHEGEEGGERAGARVRARVCAGYESVRSQKHDHYRTERIVMCI